MIHGSVRRAASVIAFGLGLGCAIAPVAGAQDDEPAPWIRMTTTSGCVFFLYDYDDPAGLWYKEAPWTWTGGCQGGVASGSGDLTTVRQADVGPSYSTGYRGAMVGGFMHGRVEEITNGKMPADYYWSTFKMGCGSDVRYVYCVPHAGASPPAQQAAAPPARTPANAPDPQALVKAGWAVIRADLDVAPEGRIIAVLEELGRNGDMTLVSRVNVLLARRYPNSPFLPIVQEILNVLDSGDLWTPKSAGVAAPAVSPRPATTPVSGAPAGAPHPGAMTMQAIKLALEQDLGFATKDIADPGDDPMYEFIVQRDGTRIPMSLSLSSNKRYIWARVKLSDGPTAQPVMVAAMRRAVDIQPSMFWVNERGLWISRAKENRDMTAADLRSMIDALADSVVNTNDVWGS